MYNFCKIVQDLLPNYMEKITFDETNQFIKEHLEQCEECTKIYNNMKSNLEVPTENIDKGVDYMRKINKEVKHLKFWKKILILIIAIILIILGIILYRYSIITKIYDQSEKSKQITNIYYSYEDNTIFKEVWRKGNLIKENETLKKSKDNVETWRNIETGESYLILYSSKTYTKAPSWYPPEGLPSFTGFSNEDSIIEKLKWAINPTISIENIKYEDKECYKIKFSQEGIPFDRELIFEKDTGFLLYEGGLGQKQNSNEWENREVKYRYKINIVTDKDIEKPNLTQYKLM